MPVATYVSVLVRSHLRQLAPLPDRELSNLQAAVRELAPVGRNLNTMTRLLQQDARQAVPGRQEVLAMLRICEALRDHVRAQNAQGRGPYRGKAGAVRGQTRPSFKDGIHRASLGSDSRYLRERVQRVAEELHDGGLKASPGKTKLLGTRSDVIAGWHAVADALLAAGHGALAEKIWGFLGGMHRPLTTDEQLASKLEERTRTRERERQERFRLSGEPSSDLR